MTFGTKHHPGYSFHCVVDAVFDKGVLEVIVRQDTRVEEMHYVSATFGTPDIWIQKQSEVKPYGMFSGARALLQMAKLGAISFANYSSNSVGWFFKSVSWCVREVISFIPRFPEFRQDSKNSPFEDPEHTQLMR